MTPKTLERKSEVKEALPVTMPEESPEGQLFDPTDLAIVDVRDKSRRVLSS